jgi:D-glycero-D-manno-heptose 1,7-bisphosphate phosphatase
MAQAVFLDRDGILNEVVVRDGRPYPPASLAELRLTARVEECLSDLKRHGFLLIVVTNQPDVARGTQTKAAVEEMNAYLASRLPIDDTYVCYHDDGDGCACRKPAPGLLLEAARRHGIELTKSFLIGDRWRDVEAGTRAHCKTLLVENGYAEKRSETPATFETNSLRSAVDWIIAQRQQEKHHEDSFGSEN